MTVPSNKHIPKMLYPFSAARSHEFQNMPDFCIISRNYKISSVCKIILTSSHKDSSSHMKKGEIKSEGEETGGKAVWSNHYPDFHNTSHANNLPISIFL